MVRTDMAWLDLVISSLFPLFLGQNRKLMSASRAPTADIARHAEETEGARTPGGGWGPWGPPLSPLTSWRTCQAQGQGWQTLCTGCLAQALYISTTEAERSMPGQPTRAFPPKFFKDNTLISLWQEHVCMLSCFSRVLVTPWTIARQAPLSMGFSRQEYWSGFHFLLQGFFPTERLNPHVLLSRQVLYHWATWEAHLLTGMTCQKTREQQVLIRMWREEDPWALLVGMHSCCGKQHDDASKHET